MEAFLSSTAIDRSRPRCLYGNEARNFLSPGAYIGENAENFLTSQSLYIRESKEFFQVSKPIQEGSLRIFPSPKTSTQKVREKRHFFSHLLNTKFLARIYIV